MALFTSDECQHLHQCVRWYKENYLPEKYQVVYDKLTIVSRVNELKRVISDIDLLFDLFHAGSTSSQLEVDLSLIPCLKRALITYRRSEANTLDSLRARTNNPEVIKRLEEMITPFDDLLQEPSFAVVPPIPMLSRERPLRTAIW
jgi:hypothetical protein